MQIFLVNVGTKLFRIKQFCNITYLNFLRYISKLTNLLIFKFLTNFHLVAFLLFWKVAENGVVDNIYVEELFSVGVPMGPFSQAGFAWDASQGYGNLGLAHLLKF